MFSTNSHTAKRFKPGSHIALALALATGAVAMTGVVADPVQAQKKKKGKKEYSKEFIAAYNPINEALGAEGADANAVKSQLSGLIAASVSADERFVTGNTVYSVGTQTSDQQLQFDGMKMMLESGKVDADKVGKFNFIAFQLARGMEKHGESRGFLQQAISNNFTTENINPSILRIEMSETYFREDNFAEGLRILKAAIAERKAAGQNVEESWYRRGLSVSFKNDIKPDIYDFVQGWISDYPTDKNWRDAVNITRQTNNYGAQETLDIMRLGFRLDTLQDKIEFIDYIEAADPRRLPKEVKDVIDHGYSTGRVTRNDIYVAESLQTASGRIAADRAELPAIEREARGASADLRTLMAAGDVFLSYGQGDKAEEFYAKALTKPGVNSALTLTRLGITQVDQGKYAEAKSTFAQVQGPRAPIAQLWTAYVDSKTAGSNTPSAPAIMAQPTASAS
jgi:tetratricopeptide (TPR) repeat protein